MYRVYDYHQIVNKKGNEITFAEPLMHEVDPQWKWELCKFNYYENIGIEDLTFAGNTQPGFLHHGNNGGDDNDYKPIGMMRLVNSWIRRVDFTNISEALSISSSANISAYDIEINGHRGHSAIRSGGSSRIFIGKVHDHSNGYIAIDENTTGTYLDNAGPVSWLRGIQAKYGYRYLECHLGGRRVLRSACHTTTGYFIRLLQWSIYQITSGRCQK